MTKQFSNYSDLLTFTRASGGHALRPVSYGDELIENGTFNTDTSGWASSGTFTATLSQSAGELSVTSTGSYGRALQAITCEVGKIYSLTCDVTEVGTTALVVVAIASSGTITNAVFSKNDITSTQTVTAIFVATQQTHYVGVGNQDVNTGVTSKFDNISVKEVTFDQPDGTLTLFEHPDGVPRVEWDADRNRLGLLVEESRTNLITYSEDFSDSSWESVGTKVPNSAISPTGENNASLLSVDYLEIRPSVTSGTQYTYSIFVKALTDSTPQIIATGTSFPNTQANFDLTDGTVTSTTAEDATIQNYGNGWFRISITETATATDSTSRLRLFCEQAYIWGAQLEEASFPTSYIKSNSGSTTTRSADVASIPVADFGYNQSVGTFLVEAQSTSGTTNAMIVSLESDTNNRIEARYSSSLNTKTRCEVVSGGVSQARLEVTDSNEVRKISFAFTKDDFASSANGSAVITDTAGTLPSATKIDIGEGTYSNSHINGHIKSIKYYPRRLTNAQLQDLTS